MAIRCSSLAGGLTAGVVRLPSWLQGVANITSHETAVKLGAALGGMKIFIPQNPKEDSALVVAVGIEDAKKICAEFGGGMKWVDVPILRGCDRELMKINILHATGTTREVALKLNCSERYVRRVRQDLGLLKTKSTHPKPQIPKERVLAEKGSPKEVAQRLGCTRSFVEKCRMERAAERRAGKGPTPRPIRELILAENGPAPEVAKRLGCTIAHVLEARAKR